MPQAGMDGEHVKQASKGQHPEYQPLRRGQQELTTIGIHRITLSNDGHRLTSLGIADGDVGADATPGAVSGSGVARGQELIAGLGAVGPPRHSRL